METISCLEKSRANVTTPNGREDDLQPFLLISTVPSCCMSETANWNVDSETGSLGSMGSDLDSISGLRRGSKGETVYTGSGDSPCATPKCSELGETADPEVNGQLRLHGQRISCLGMSSIDVTTSSGSGDPPSVAPSGYKGSKLRETTNLKASTLACSGKSSTNVTPEASLEDTQASEILYPTG